MQSKKQKQGKSGKKIENLQVQRQRYRDDSTENSKYPGAYKIGIDVLCLMRDNTNYNLAEILAIRDAKFFKEEVNDSTFDDKDLYDELPVQQHPAENTNEENKMTYMAKYIEEFREDFAKKQADAEKENVEEGKYAEDVKMTNNEEEGAPIDATEKEILDSFRYEYYIHYKGIDRRNDRWVTEQFIKIEKEEIATQLCQFSKEDEDKKNKDSMDREKLFFNDENHGMSEKQI